jgi:hypothetical protein
MKIDIMIFIHITRKNYAHRKPLIRQNGFFLLLKFVTLKKLKVIQNLCMGLVQRFVNLGPKKRVFFKFINIVQYFIDVILFINLKKKI